METNWAGPTYAPRLLTLLILPYRDGRDNARRHSIEFNYSADLQIGEGNRPI
jgi:hypothetical protein